MTQAATRIELAVTPRSVLGKKVKVLRRQGMTPANIYGHGLASEAVQVPTPDLARTIRAVGLNTMLQLQVEGEKKLRPVFVRRVQRNPITDEFLHVDFYQVSLKEKIRIEVPLVIVGEAPAVNTYRAVLLHSVNTITVEGLPTDLPPHIEVDVSGLVEFDDAVHVKDLAVSPNITLMVDPELVVAKVAPPRLVEEVVVEEAEVPAEAAEGEKAEAEAAEKE
ncbi:MAG: 50S ribosomal protein L25 [Dehalococcoidia bacterium]|jgi:large subunit ribosomal protein L25|nr:50S ribosomal protein L25 [Dehalococcoidia bacterium]